MRDEDIAAIVNAEIGAEGLGEMLSAVGLQWTGDVVADLKAIAQTMRVDVEDLLYALFVDEPLFDDDTWANLTKPPPEE